MAEKVPIEEALKELKEITKKIEGLVKRKKEIEARIHEEKLKIVTELKDEYLKLIDEREKIDKRLLEIRGKLYELGERAPRVKKPPVKPKRVMIKPAIIRYMSERPGVWVHVNEVKAAVGTHSGWVTTVLRGLVDEGKVEWRKGTGYYKWIA